MTTVTFGADPELFLRNSVTGDTTPVCGLFGGTKGKPIPLGELGEGYGLQEDNVMLEYNVPPASARSEFASHLARAYAEVGKLVHTIGYEIDTAPSRVFAHSKLTHPGAQVFGCSPDFNAYEHGAPLPPIDLRVLRTDGGEWRFAGGHLHLGYSMEIPHFVVAAFCDVIIGLNSLEFDKQGERRKFYGTAGRFRPTKWGLEYRTMSNAWIHKLDDTIQMTHLAEEFGQFLTNTPKGVMQKLYTGLMWGDIREAINTEDADWARHLYGRYQEMRSSIMGVD